MTPATAGDPIASANIEAPRAVRPITKPKNWPLFTSASIARKAANSISCWCLVSDSAITKIRSAAPGTSRSYPSRTEGGGIGPEKVDCWNCATGLVLPFAPGAVTAPLAVLTALLGCFCFCDCGRAIISERTASAAYGLADMGEMTSHAFSTATTRNQLPQVACRRQVHHAPYTTKIILFANIHVQMIAVTGLIIKSLKVIKNVTFQHGAESQGQF
jgi:hypothetical protein